MKIIVHGIYEDWIATKKELKEMLSIVQIGANQDCNISIDGIRKTVKEWQNEKINFRVKGG